MVIKPKPKLSPCARDVVLAALCAALFSLRLGVTGLAAAQRSESRRRSSPLGAGGRATVHRSNRKVNFVLVIDPLLEEAKHPADTHA